MKTQREIDIEMCGHELTVYGSDGKKPSAESAGSNAQSRPMKEWMFYHCKACRQNIAGDLEPVYECPLCGAVVEFLTEERRPTGEGPFSCHKPPHNV
jgi:predicted RNA-binding Zn-ribbon protein involved in translation (DUF1610 family)